jgi:4-hydroxy-tetrahydrodipicolinate synthase
MQKQQLPGGLWPVMLTPFTEEGSIDYYSLDELIEFYLEQGASGLFANCLSSEMYHLTQEEGADLVSHVIKRVNNRVAVVATGTFGFGPGSHSDMIKTMYDLGVTAVVMVSSQIVRDLEKDELFKSRIESILEETHPVPLGMYECPEPYKRLLSPELVEYMSSTGRFVYYKETSCDLMEIKKKLDRIRNTSPGLYNANTPTALDSLKQGARGLSPISANYYPELYTRLYEWFDSPDHELEAIRLQRHLTLMDAITRIKYPLMAKIFLARRGLKMSPYTRIMVSPLVFEEKMMLEALAEHYRTIVNEFMG